jgi:hypothetical protein
LRRRSVVVIRIAIIRVVSKTSSIRLYVMDRCGGAAEMRRESGPGMLAGCEQRLWGVSGWQRHGTVLHRRDKLGLQHFDALLHVVHFISKRRESMDKVHLDLLTNLGHHYLEVLHAAVKLRHRIWTGGSSSLRLPRSVGGSQVASRLLGGIGGRDLLGLQGGINRAALCSRHRREEVREAVTKLA